VLRTFDPITQLRSFCAKSSGCFNRPIYSTHCIC